MDIFSNYTASAYIRLFSNSYKTTYTIRDAYSDYELIFSQIDFFFSFI